MKRRPHRRLLSALEGVSDPAALAANIGSMTCLALAGAVLNLLVGRIFGFEGLGVFSQALLFFLLLGQLTAGGFAFAALYHFSQNGPDDPDARAYLVAMSLPTCAMGASVAIVLWYSGSAIGSVFGSVAVGKTLPAVGLGVLLFGLNKIWASALNGMQLLKTYAVFQGLRMPLMLLVFLWLVAQGGGITSIGWVFAVSEALLGIGLVAALLANTRRGAIRPRTVLLLIGTEGVRGWRGALIGILADANTKIDLVVLSLLSNDLAVGIYALGGLFADGLRMALAAIQNVINPRVSQVVMSGDWVGYEDLWNNLARLGRIGAATIAILGVGFMLVAVADIMNADQIDVSTWVFGIIGASSVMAAPAIILNQTFTQAGRPGLQTQFFAVIAGGNLCLNIVLVPVFGPVGAAVATAVAEVGQLWLLRSWLNRIFDLPDAVR